MITVIPDNDAPVLTGTNTSLEYIENSDAIQLLPDFSVSDVDDTSASAIVQIVASDDDGDVLVVDPADSDVVVTSANTENGDLLSAAISARTHAELESKLGKVYFNSTSHKPAVRTRTVKVTITDEKSSGDTATAATAVFERLVDVTPVNDGPVLELSGNVDQVFVEDNSPVTVLEPSGSVSITDADDSTMSRLVV